MIKYILLLMAFAATGCGGAQEQKTETAKEAAAPVQYVKADLQKIKWIEGKWKGLYNGTPFYEIYQFINDSTLESISYDWNGKDSSNSKKGYVYFKDGAYYHGEKQNWKVSAISEAEIKMLPNVEAYNDIVWRYKDSANWDAILTATKGGVTTYNMQSFDPFKK